MQARRGPNLKPDTEARPPRLATAVLPASPALAAQPLSAAQPLLAKQVHPKPESRLLVAAVRQAAAVVVPAVVVPAVVVPAVVVPAVVVRRASAVVAPAAQFKARSV
jgi:hypothetical protein